MLIGWIFGMYETFSIWRMLLMLSISRRHGSKSHHRQKAWLIRRHGEEKTAFCNREETVVSF